MRGKLATRENKISSLWKADEQYLMDRGTEEQINTSLIDYPGMPDEADGSATEPKRGTRGGCGYGSRT